MSAKSTYTTYVGGTTFADNTDARKLLAKLFPADPTYPTMQALQKAVGGGDETTAKAQMYANATAPVVAGVGGLVPSDGKQTGDLQMFTSPVDLSYAAAPDVTTVAWKNPGDPANPYFPDITSPGPGKTDGADKSTDPKIKTTDVPATNIDTAGADLRDPSTDGPAIYGANKLGSIKTDFGWSGAGPKPKV